MALSAVVFGFAASTAVAIQLQGDGGFVGTNGPDLIQMGNGNDTAYGQGGSDVIQAGNGNDTIDGDGHCTVPPGHYPNGIPGSPGCEHGQIPTTGLGDVIQAGIVYTGELASFGITAFALLNVVMTAGWIAVAAGLNRRLREQTGGGRPL